MLQVKKFTFNPFEENTYILYDETKEAVIIDPGCYEQGERGLLNNFITGNGLKVSKLINTHCHIDHVLGNSFVKSSFGVPLFIHKNEIPVLSSVKVYASNYGFPKYEESEPDDFLDEKDKLIIGKHELDILFVPGHSPGHLVFYDADSGTCIAGDTLFQGSIGRTDLPGGDHHTLLSKIKSELFSLPNDTVVYPGHGPETSIGMEKKHNPFVGQSAGFFR